MDTFDLKSIELVKSGETGEAAQTGELNDAVYEPSTRIEQTGEYRISEAIQVDFTAVMDNTAATAADLAIGKKTNDGHGSHFGQDAGDAVWGYEPKDIQGRSGENSTGPADSFRRGSLTLQGSEDENTVVGREWNLVEGPFRENGGGGSVAVGENVTPINLPNVRHEVLQAKRDISHKTRGELGIEIDPDTGQVSGPADGGGEETKSSYVVAAAESNSSSALEPARNPGEIGNTPPPRMAEPAGGREPSRMPIGPAVSDEPPTMDKPGKGLTQGSTTPTGPEIIGDDRFADQALDAIGYGLIGAKSGDKGSVYGTGAMGHGGKTIGKGYANSDYDSKGSSSSGGGAPVHGYGPGAKGDGSSFVCFGTTGEGKSVNFGGKSNSDSKSTAERAGNFGQLAGGSGNCGVSDGKTAFDVSWGPSSDGGTSVKITKIGNTLDGGSAIPYTGNWSGGKFQPANPGTIGGKGEENDSGRVMPVIRNSGMGDQGGGGNSTDGPSEWDDGNWYGGIFGGGGVYTDSGGALPIDPKPH